MAYMVHKYFTGLTCRRIGDTLVADPMSKKDDTALQAKIRHWREVQLTCQKLKPLLNEARKYEDKERALRKEIGEMMGSDLSISVDDKIVVHITETRNNGIDYELAWAEALRMASARQRRKMLSLLHYRIITIHKLATE